MNPNPGNYPSRSETLPLDQVSALELLELFRDPDHDVDRIVEFISRDPLLSAETLRRCNAASFSGAERTTDIFEAVSRLGYYELYGIIAASIARGQQGSAFSAKTDGADSLSWSGPGSAY
jgi:HD-like signal output (HDOD) protein